MKRHLAAVAALALPIVAAAPALAGDTTEVFWSMPDGGSPSRITWPQTYSPSGASECGVWYQVDRYPTSKVPGLIADGMLHYGEDHGIALSWRFVFGGDCEPTPTPTPTPSPEPTSEPSAEPTTVPTTEPTTEPTTSPTEEPTTEPTETPATEPTEQPTTEPTTEPTTVPTTTATTEPTPQIGRGIWANARRPEPAAATRTGTLADTGADDWLLPVGVTGAVLIAVGAGFALRGRGRR